MTATEIIRLLGLEPHPAEGGFFTETYRPAESIPAGALPERYGSPRSVSTAIYYLLTPESCSPMHRLASDEIFHFYAGRPVEMLMLRPGGGGEIVVLGPDLAAGMKPQVLVPRGVWQGPRLEPGGGEGAFALLGTTVAPGFEYDDYEEGERAELIRRYPDFGETIVALTRG